MKTRYTTPHSHLLVIATICGAALMLFPQKAHAFLWWSCPSQQNNCILSCAVTQAGNQCNRDIVVLDKNKTILADTVSQNVGTKYTFDTKKEITATLSDGKTRTFIEKSADYPKGIRETVYAVKNKKGEIIGAMIVSRDSIR